MDLKAIADALAARFVGTTAGGESLVNVPTASLPNAVAKGPVLLVFPPTGDLSLIMGPTNRDTYDFPIRLIRDPVDLPNRIDLLYAWAQAMRFKVEGNMDLDLAYVAWAQPVAMTFRWDDYDYRGALFDAVQLVVRVQINEVTAGIAT